MERQMTREEFVKQGLMLSEEDMIKLSHGYSSRVPYPKNELEFKEMIANAYLAGTELMVDFYLKHRIGMEDNFIYANRELNERDVIINFLKKELQKKTYCRQVMKRQYRELKQKYDALLAKAGK